MCVNLKSTKQMNLLLNRITLAVALAAATGAAQAAVVSSGSTTVPGTYLMDLDNGTMPLTFPYSGSDFFWNQQTSTTRQVAQNPFAPSGQFVNLGVVNFASITLAQLQSYSYSSAPINGSDVGNLLVPGDVFAVLTDSGNYAKVLVTGEFDRLQDNGLPIQWETLSPVPEPSTYLAGLGALSMLGALARRNRR